MKCDIYATILISILFLMSYYVIYPLVKYSLCCFNMGLDVIRIMTNNLTIKNTIDITKYLVQILTIFIVPILIIISGYIIFKRFYKSRHRSSDNIIINNIKIIITVMIVNICILICVHHNFITSDHYGYEWYLITFNSDNFDRYATCNQLSNYYLYTWFEETKSVVVSSKYAPTIDNNILYVQKWG